MSEIINVGKVVPIKGVDYYTNAEKTGMENEIITNITPKINENMSNIEQRIKTEFKEDIDNKVDKIPSKTLSTNDYTNEEKQKLSNLNNYNDTEVKVLIQNISNSLINYYLKSETYSKTEINSLIGSIEKVTIQFANELPEIGENNVIYFVPSSSIKVQNEKDEYIYANGKWEQIGSTAIDLTGYATEEYVNNSIKEFLTESQINTLLLNKVNYNDVYTKTEIDNKGYLTEHQSLVGYATENYVQQYINSLDAEGVEY